MKDRIQKTEVRIQNSECSTHDAEHRTQHETMFEIRYDDSQLKQLERTLAGIPRAMPKVMSRALNRTATEGRTQVARSLSKRMGLRVKDIRETTTIRRASYRNWRSAVDISKRRIPIYRFGAKQKPKGVTYRKDRKRVLIPHSFIQTMPSGHTGVFRRKTAGRLPIVELRGPSPAQVFIGAEAEANRILAESRERLAKNIHDQVNLILRRRAG